MTEGGDAASVLARVGTWAAELRERQQISDALASRLTGTLAEAFGERLDQPDDPLLVVMLCGPTAVGKSSLINALAGAEISRPGLGATTAAAVVYVHEADDPSRLYAYSHALGQRDSPDTALVRHRRDALLHTVLVDTPDIDSVRLQHRELTARLVHAADVVLFVTSPEKYKVMQSARWVMAQRGQRALAFVLNKWDRAGLGLQAERRGAIEADFRTVLAGEGFDDALVFRVSATGADDGMENDLPALFAWLESGISQSSAALIRGRRLRAAWGRLAAVIEEATPAELSGQALVSALRSTIETRGALTQQAVAAEAALLEVAGVEDGGFPATPGLLGLLRRGWQRIGAAAGSVRAGLAAVAGRGALGQHVALAESTFGGRHVAVLAETAAQGAADAAAQGVALGPVGAAWTAGFAELGRQLAVLPPDVAGDLAARAGRLTLRRVLGVGFVYGIELLILGVMVLALVRVGEDFVAGSYAPGGLFISVVMLTSILAIIGQTVGTLFFPPLRQRLRRVVARQAQVLVKAAVDRALGTLREQVAAVDRLAREGRALSADIDSLVMALTVEGSDAGVGRLFGEGHAAAEEMAIGDAPGAPAAGEGERRPVFD